MTLEEAEKFVFEQIKQGKNPREISQIEFLIDGIVRKFNINQIHQIKEKFSPKIQEKHRDPDKALAFQLFKKGCFPIEVIIKTKFPSEFVQKAYEEFLEFEGKQVVPKAEIQDLNEMAKDRMYPSHNFSDLKHFIEQIVPDYDKYQELAFICKKCGKYIFPSGKSLDDARNYLAGKYVHYECAGN